MSGELVGMVVNPPPELLVAAVFARATRHADRTAVRLARQFMPKTQLVSHFVVLASVDLEMTGTTPRDVSDVLKPTEKIAADAWRLANYAEDGLAAVFRRIADELLRNLPR